jgi:hypothetical protein
LSDGASFLSDTEGTEKEEAFQPPMAANKWRWILLRAFGAPSSYLRLSLLIRVHPRPPFFDVSSVSERKRILFGSSRFGCHPGESRGL